MYKIIHNFIYQTSYKTKLYKIQVYRPGIAQKFQLNFFLLFHLALGRVKPSFHNYLLKKFKHYQYIAGVQVDNNDCGFFSPMFTAGLHIIKKY